MATETSPAGASCNGNRALVLLDVQCAVLSEPPVGIPDGATIGENIATVLTQARNGNPPPCIVHVRTCGEPGEADAPNTPGWQLVHTPLPNEIVIDKHKNSAFSGTSLGNIIPRDAEVVIVGLCSDYSVKATCGSALDRGNEVILVRGAHGTYDRRDLVHGSAMTMAATVSNEIEDELEELGVHVLDMKYVHGIFNGR